MVDYQELLAYLRDPGSRECDVNGRAVGPSCFGPTTWAAAHAAGWWGNECRRYHSVNGVEQPREYRDWRAAGPGGEGIPIPFYFYRLADFLASPGETRDELVRRVSACRQEYPYSWWPTERWRDVDALYVAARLVVLRDPFARVECPDCQGRGVSGYRRVRMRRQQGNRRSGSGFGKSPVRCRTCSGHKTIGAVEWSEPPAPEWRCGSCRKQRWPGCSRCNQTGVGWKFRDRHTDEYPPGQKIDGARRRGEVMGMYRGAPGSPKAELPAGLLVLASGRAIPREPGLVVEETPIEAEPEATRP